MDEIIHLEQARARTHARPTETGRDPYDGLRFWSALTHGTGAALALAGTVLLLWKAVLGGGGLRELTSFAIYGTSMVALYIASTLYHSVGTTVSGRIALRKFDHISIYFLIAGTYTPICLLALRGGRGWTLFGVIWVLALAGTVMALTWIDCPRAVTSTVYLAMGWLAVTALVPIYRAVGRSGMFWLLLGGMFYTVGGILYALKWPRRDDPHFGCHEIFHMFILLGSIAHFFMIYRILA